MESTYGYGLYNGVMKVDRIFCWDEKKELIAIVYIKEKKETNK